MNATFRRPILAVILLAAAAVSAGATAPNLMTYQGRVKESGLPVTGVRAVDVFLCPDAVVPIGSCVDTGVQNVSVTNGLFRTTFTAPSGASFLGGQTYLQLQVNGSLFTPREQLEASAYAVYASSAATLVPNPGDAAVFVNQNLTVGGDFSVSQATLTVTGGNVGIGTNLPGTTLEVSGQVTLSGAAHVRATGAGVAVPSVAAGCGTGSVTGSDAVGRITVGLGTAPTLTTCQIAFGTSWTGTAPVCHFTNESGNVEYYVVSAVDTFSVTFVPSSGALTTGDVISYICLSY